MSDNDNKIHTRKPTSSERIRKIVDTIEHEFWIKLATAFPECVTGDVDPGTVAKLRIALTGVADSWYETNRPDHASSVASCQLNVIMRLPKRGERMWWVTPEAARSAESALAVRNDAGLYRAPIA